MSSRSPEFDAHQLALPQPLHTFSPQIYALLYDPISTALALRHSDSSFSLYPSFSPLAHSSFPPHKSLVPSPTSSAAFVHLRTAASPTTTLFVTSAPLLRPAPATLLRFYALRGDRFVKIEVGSNHRDLEFDPAKGGVLFKVGHGVSVKLSAGVNVFALYSVSNSKIWVFAARLVGDGGGGGDVLKLMKCAVIDCCSPVFSIGILFGFMVLGEENGVRFFPLQRLVKGNQKKERKSNGRRIPMGKAVSTDGDLNVLPAKVERSEKHSDTVKLRSSKLRQDSKDMGAFFVALNDKDADSSIPTKINRRPIKAISIEALSATYFVVLDSDGDVHLLCAQGLDNPCIVKRLTQTMKVAKLAVFHDISTVTRVLWMSDGCHTVHLMSVLDANASFDEIDNKEAKEKHLQTSVTQAIFTSEKIQDVVPLAANSVLILGQGSLFAYAVL